MLKKNQNPVKVIVFPSEGFMPALAAGPSLSHGWWYSPRLHCNALGRRFIAAKKLGCVTGAHTPSAHFLHFASFFTQCTLFSNSITLHPIITPATAFKAASSTNRSISQPFTATTWVIDAPFEQWNYHYHYHVWVRDTLFHTKPFFSRLMTILNKGFYKFNLEICPLYFYNDC